MTRQRKENCAVPADARKGVQTQDFVYLEGGKAIPVNKQTGQLLLPFVTAEKTAGKLAHAKTRKDADVSASCSVEEPKAEDKKSKSPLGSMKGVIGNLEQALKKVTSNKGAPGPDGQTTDYVKEHKEEVINVLKRQLLSGKYRPGETRRVWIPKDAGKGMRGLGIPNVTARIVQEAIRMELESIYEPIFHPSSHGFRPNRSCHSAIKASAKYIREGFRYVVDIDLEKFFDTVCHQRLMASLEIKIKDNSVLNLINKLLRAGTVMPDGIVVRNEEGVPQGGPLSPLLSNVVLNELDWELSRRGHKFVRYADDCNIYVKSRKAGERTKASLSKFIERKLRLKVNNDKSAVDLTGNRHFLGFTLRNNPRKDGVSVYLSEKSRKRAYQKIAKLTPRNWGYSIKFCIERLNKFIKGWFNFFSITSAREKRTMNFLDGHIRRRLRAIQLKHWKRKRTVFRKLISIGIKWRVVWKNIYDGRKGIWAQSNTWSVNVAMSNTFFRKSGLISLEDLCKEKLKETELPRKRKRRG